jgi:hypothetical protein
MEMESRKVLDYRGIIVGQLELPVGTSEEVWQKKLAVFAQAPEPESFAPISPRQIRLQLFQMGVTAEMISAGLGSLPEPQKSLAAIEWEYATQFVRENPLVEQVAQLLGWSPDQLDTLWREGSKL